jgi:SRSO17 transposase
MKFTTKPDLAAGMITGAAGAGVPFAWVAADEVYGRSSRFQEEMAHRYVICQGVRAVSCLIVCRRRSRLGVSRS